MIKRRILEQGAPVAVIIAETTTQIRAKYIENLISEKMNITQYVRENNKINSLKYSNNASIKLALAKTRSSINEGLSIPELKLNEPLTEFYLSNFSKSFSEIDIFEKNNVLGKVKFLRGRYVVLENDGFYSLLNLVKLRGAVLEIGSDSNVKKESLAKFI